MARQVVKGKLDLDAIEREIQYRSWFEHSELLDDRDVIPDDEVELIVGSFQKFCEDAVRIKVPGKRVSFKLRPAQLDTIRSWVQYRYTITLKARQIGFSTLAAAFALWCAIGGGNRQIYMLSRREEDSVALLNKCKVAWLGMPGWVRERAPAALDKTRLQMSFDNDSFIKSSPTASDPIRGETAFLVIADEWASFPNQEEAWNSIEPATDIGGRLVGLSTAKGEGDFFHRMWVGAITESNTFYPIFHAWDAVPGRDQEWYEDKKRKFEPWQLHQEYPANAEEAFIGSGNPYFDLDILREMVAKEPEGVYTIELTRSGAKHDLIEDEHGLFTVWQHPKEGVAYVVGADIAQGLEHGDWSVAYVMDAESGDMVAKWRGKPAPDRFGEILCAIGYRYNHAVVAPEANNHGVSTIKEMMRNKYPRLYRRRTRLRRQESPTETMGWLTTHGNKTELVNEVSKWIRDNNVPDEGTVAELKTFRRDQRGERIRLHGSPHDDCVMALAITVACRKYATANKIKAPVASEVRGSLAWWEKQMERSKRGRKRSGLRPVF